MQKCCRITPTLSVVTSISRRTRSDWAKWDYSLGKELPSSCRQQTFPLPCAMCHVPCVFALGDLAGMVFVFYQLCTILPWQRLHMLVPWRCPWFGQGSDSHGIAVFSRALRGRSAGLCSIVLILHHLRAVTLVIWRTSNLEHLAPLLSLIPAFLLLLPHWELCPCCLCTLMRVKSEMFWL